MNEIQSALLNLLPPGRKNTTGGWVSFNAVCCHHRGETMDKRKRGGVKVDGDNWSYHCFNCGFKAGWSPGKLLSKNTKQLFKWLGLAESEIGKLNLVALKQQENKQEATKTLNFDLNEVDLPADCKPINDWIAQDPDNQDLIDIINYIVQERGMHWDWYNWHWSPEPGYKDRVIIPFYQDKKIVGYTGRKIKNGKPKYLTEGQSGYVFNLDSQTYDRQYVILVEGQFDAIAIDGVALMTNEPNEVQAARINALGKEVICVPDKDAAGAKMLKSAIAQNWSVSLPPWEDDIKDVADAVKRYGRIYALTTILHYRVRGEIKINLLMKKLESLKDE